MWKKARKLPLIKTTAYQGYLVEDVQKILYPPRVERFKQWLSNRNVILYAGQELVRKEELEFFLGRKILESEETVEPLLLDIN